MLSKVLENDRLLIEVSSIGAELLRIYDKVRDLELLHDGSSDWNKRSPILFPYIGVQKNEFLQIYDDSYKTLRHGFIRDLEFNIEIKDNSIVCSKSFFDEYNYPFSFDLSFTYTILDNTLCCNALVTNHSYNTMYYHLGFHPGFRVEDSCKVVLNSKKHKELILLKDEGLLTKHVLTHKDSILNINDDLFINDTYITLNNYNTLDLYSNNVKLFTLKTDAPVVSFWRKSSKSSYLCIEPWFGICDYLKQGRSITDKKFIIRLLPEDSNNHSFTLIL